MFEASHTSYSSFDDGRRRAPVGLVAACVVLVVIAAFLGFAVYQQKVVLNESLARLDQAILEDNQAKADQAKLTALASDFQQQLDNSRLQRAAQRDGVAKAQEVQADLQAQLNDTRAELRLRADESAALHGRLAQAGEESSRLRAELGQANRRAAALEAELAKSHQDLAKVQGDLAALQVQPQAQPLPQVQPQAQEQVEPQPGAQPLVQAQPQIQPLPPPAIAAAQPLPVDASFKKAFLGGKYTLRVKNVGSGPLNVVITATSPARTLGKSITLKSGKTFDFGKIAAGAHVVIAGEGYAPVELIAQ